MIWKQGDVSQQLQTSRYRMNEFWGPNVQNGDYNSVNNTELYT